MTKPLISVCLPTYNRAEFLAGAIESILGQTYVDFEFLILNDGATDSTEEVIQQFKDSRIHYVKNKTNLGYVASLNKCAALAQGKWVLFFSDDDWLLPETLEKMLEVLRENQQREIGMVIPQTILIDTQSKVISNSKKQLRSQEYLLLKPGEFIPNYTLYGQKIRGKYQFNTSFPATLFNREIFLQQREGSEKVPVAHDLLIGAKICLKYPVLVLDEPLIKYRVHENWGASLNREGRFLEEYLTYLELLFEFVEKEKIEFDYNFEKYCYDALVKYLFRLNGGLLRLTARYQGSYWHRLGKVFEYIRFGLKTKPVALLSPQFCLTLLASLLPQKVLLKGYTLFKV